MKLGGIPYWTKTFHKDLWTLSNAFLSYFEKIAHMSVV